MICEVVALTSTSSMLYSPLDRGVACAFVDVRAALAGGGGARAAPNGRAPRGGAKGSAWYSAAAGVSCSHGNLGEEEEAASKVWRSLVKRWYADLPIFLVT